MDLSPSRRIRLAAAADEQHSTLPPRTPTRVESDVKLKPLQALGEAAADTPDPSIPVGVPVPPPHLLVRSASLPTSPPQHQLMESCGEPGLLSPTSCLSPFASGGGSDPNQLPEPTSRRCSGNSLSSCTSASSISMLGHWNSPESTLPSTPEGGGGESLRPHSRIAHEAEPERRTEIIGDLRNPCHQLLALVELLEGSPAFSGLVEERDMLRTIRSAATTIRSIVVGDAMHALTGPIASATHARMSSSAHSTPLHGGQKTSSPQQMRIPMVAPPSMPSMMRTLPRSISSSTGSVPSPGSATETMVSRTSRTPPLPTATLAARSAGASAPRFDINQLNILMVDDMSMNRKVLRKMLETVPAVDVACDGLEAVNLVRAKMEAHLKIKLPPIPNLEALISENLIAHPCMQPSPTATPLQTPCGTPTASTTPTTPMILLASPEATSPSNMGSAFHSVLNAGVPVARHSRLASVELPSAEDRGERHHSFPVPYGAPAQLVHQTSTGAVGTTPVDASAPSPSATASPLSPPLVMPATPVVVMLSPTSSRRYSMPMPMKAPASLGSGVLLSSTAGAATLPGTRPQYDCIISDLNMPNLSGLQEVALIRQLEAEYGLPPVPIIAVTSNTLTSDRLACARHDFDYFISKPFNRRDIIGVLELIVHARTQQQHSLGHMRRAVITQQLQQQQQLLTPMLTGGREGGRRSSMSELPQFSMLPASAMPSPRHEDRQISITMSSPPSDTSCSSLGSQVSSGSACSSEYAPEPLSRVLSPSRRFALNRDSDAATSPVAVSSAFFQRLNNTMTSPPSVTSPMVQVPVSDEPAIETSAHTTSLNTWPT